MMIDSNFQQLRVLEVLKNFKQQQHDDNAQSMFSLLEAQFEHGPESQKLQFLSMLESLGKAAGEDLMVFNLRSRKDESDELGISGFPLNLHTKSPLYNSDDLFGYTEKTLPEDDSPKRFRSLLIECQSILRQLIDPNLEIDILKQLLQREDELMVLLRRYKALCSIGLSLPAQDEETWHKELHELFKETYEIFGSVEQNERPALIEMLTCAWVWEKGPPPSILLSSSSALENLSLRIYGVMALNCHAVTVELRQDMGDVVSSPQKIQYEKESNQDSGVVLHLSKINLNNLQGSRKNQKKGSDCKLYRVDCKVPMPLSFSSYCQFQCLSLPFTIRTGSPQLWPYTSAIVWFIWTQKDVREPDNKCPAFVEIDSILGLIQARIIAAGLRLSSKALWDCLPQNEKDTQEYSLTSMLPHKLTNGERQGWTDMIKELCAVGQENKVYRSNFVKQMPEKQCIWLLVCAAVNTGLRLKKYDLDRFYHIGLPNRMCRSFPGIDIGDFILRSSLNRIENNLSNKPHTKVVVQVCTNTEVEPVLVVVDEFDKWTLQEKVCNISIGKVDNKCVYRILPSKEDVRTIEEQTRGTKKGKGNYTGSKQEELPPRLLIKPMESLSINTNSEMSPALSNASHSTCSPTLMKDQETEDEEPVRKKSVLSNEAQIGEQSQLHPTEMDITVIEASAVQVTASLVSTAHTQISCSKNMENLCFNSLDCSSLSSDSDKEDLENERFLSLTDVDFAMKDIPPDIVKDVFLSESDMGEIQDSIVPDRIFSSPHNCATAMEQNWLK